MDASLPLSPCSPADLVALFAGGERTVEVYDRALLGVARAQGIVDAALAEWLAALQRRRRLVELAFHLGDHARERLGLAERTTQALARLGRAFEERPLLRDAVRAGAVKLRAAQTIVPVARGEHEALWIALARHLSVRELEAVVRRAQRGDGAPEEPWLRLAAQVTADERVVIEEGLSLAGQLLPEGGEAEQLEAMAQELISLLSPTDRQHGRVGPETGFTRVRQEPEGERKALLELESRKWGHLPGPGDWELPEAPPGAEATAQEVEAGLLRLAGLRAQLDEVLGHCAHAVKKGGLHLRLGFASFRHFVEERLGLPARAVEQRVALEEKLQGSPALRAARAAGLSYEKLRALSALPEKELASWAELARYMTCIALRRGLEDRARGQLRAARRVSVPVPERVALVVADAVEALRLELGQVSVGSALALMAYHFIAVWKAEAAPPETLSQGIRERDGHRCQVPGCSRRAVHAHHILPRSQGGSDEPANLVGLCAFHHLLCIHEGQLRVERSAGGTLSWTLRGAPFTGGVEPGAASAGGPTVH